MRSGEVQHLISVMGEVDPRPPEQFAGNAVQRFADDAWRVVGRAGIGDDPISDERANRGKATRNRGYVVPHNHRQANLLMLWSHDLIAWQEMQVGRRFTV
jgi:hypothetical protein